MMDISQSFLWYRQQPRSSINDESSRHGTQLTRLRTSMWPQRASALSSIVPTTAELEVCSKAAQVQLVADGFA
jgi:hypothetical protein